MDLQRVTKSLSDIGQAPPLLRSTSPADSRRTLPSRRNHVTQKVRVPGRTLYISVHDDPAPAEVFLRIKGQGCTTETIALYDVIARVASLALQCGASLDKVGEMLLGTKFEPAGPVQQHLRIKNCSSLCDLIGRHLLVEHCGREELAHVPVTGQAHQTEEA